MRFLWTLIIPLFLVLLVSGCTQNVNTQCDLFRVKETGELVCFGCGVTRCIDPAEDQVVLIEENSDMCNPHDCTLIETVNQTSMTDLMVQLESKVNDYNASYTKTHKYDSWGGHSGATSYSEEWNISIEVSEEEVTSYIMRYIKDTSYSEDEDYYKIYNYSNKELCQYNVRASSSCVTSETPMSPEMAGSIMGCEVRSSGGSNSCVCDGEGKSINVRGRIEPELPCIENIQTDGLELWDEFNIIYYPSTNESLCYFVTTSKSDPKYAFECTNDHIELIPNIKTEQDLENMICRYRKYNYGCSCSFDPINIKTGCEEETPLNFDSETKDTILKYVVSSKIISMEEQDNEYGHCYISSYNNLEHMFCFDERDGLTFAQWGKNLRNGYSNVDNHKVVKI